MPYFLVADGMGGGPAGEVASTLATGAAAQVLSQQGLPPLQKLALAFQKAHQAIVEAQADRYALKGMGTTLCSILLTEERAFSGNVGDSRGYIWRERKLKQVTRDHSWVGQLVEVGLLNEEEALVHPYKNILTRVLGLENSLPADIRELKLEAHDVLLLATDGFSGEIDRGNIRAEEIGFAIENYPLEETVPQLIGLAKEHGGEDNLTLIVIKLIDWGEI